MRSYRLYRRYRRYEFHSDCSRFHKTLDFAAVMIIWDFSCMSGAEFLLVGIGGYLYKADGRNTTLRLSLCRVDRGDERKMASTIGLEIL